MKEQMAGLSIKDLLVLYYAGMPYSEFDECPPWTFALGQKCLKVRYFGTVWDSIYTWELTPKYLEWLEKEANNEQTQ